MARTRALLTELGALVEHLRREDFAARLVGFMHACAPFEDMAIFSYSGYRAPVVLYERYANPEPATALKDYLTGAYLLDPFYHAWLAGAAPGVYRLADITPDRFARSAYYENFYRKTGIVDELGMNVYLGSVPDQTASARFASRGSALGLYRGLGVSLCRSRAMGRFRRHEIDRLVAFEPVLRALMAQHWRAADHGAERSEALITDATAPPGRIADALRRRSNVSLTPRQAEVVGLILRGASSTSIALRLGISPETVKVHRKNIYAKLNISSQAELFATVISVLTGQPAERPTIP